MGYSYLACKNILKGLKRITINNSRMKIELNEHWEVLAEAIQTILRKTGSDNALSLIHISTCLFFFMIYTNYSTHYFISINFGAIPMYSSGVKVINLSFSSLGRRRSFTNSTIEDCVIFVPWVMFFNCS